MDAHDILNSGAVLADADEGRASLGDVVCDVCRDITYRRQWIEYNDWRWIILVSGAF